MMLTIRPDQQPVLGNGLSFELYTQIGGILYRVPRLVLFDLFSATVNPMPTGTVFPNGNPPELHNTLTFDAIGQLWFIDYLGVSVMVRGGQGQPGGALISQEAVVLPGGGTTILGDGSKTVHIHSMLLQTTAANTITVGTGSTVLIEDYEAPVGISTLTFSMDTLFNDSVTILSNLSPINVIFFYAKGF